MGALRAAFLAALVVASPVAGQYVELAPRRPGLAAPVADPFLRPGDEARVGIPSAHAFVESAGSAALVRVGAFPVLIIPALFVDSQEPHIQPGALADVLFRGPAPGGELARFYRELSRGRLELTGTVAPWVRTPISLLDAATSVDGHGWIGPRIDDYVTAAVQAADSVIDFGQFDNNGPDGIPNTRDDDGIVDAIAIEHLEVSGNCGGPGPWAHLGTISGNGVLTQDRRPNGQFVRVVRYVADGVTDCSGGRVQDAAVIAHELGHVLGLPDDYFSFGGVGPDYRRWNVGCFELMAAGSWGCGNGPRQDGFGPIHMGPLHLATLGWLDVDLIPPGTVDQEVILHPVQSPLGRAVKIPLTDDGSEYYLVSYRRRVGFDEDLPAEGVLIHHVDTDNETRSLPDGLPWIAPHHLVEADGDAAMRRVERDGGNRGAAGDVFARDGRVDSLTDRSVPSTRDHLGRPTGVALRAIRIEGGVARMRVTTRDRFAVVARSSGPPHATSPFSARLRTAGGTLPLTVTELAGHPLPPGLAVSASADTIKVTGVPMRAGLQLAAVEVRDALGKSFVEWMSLSVTEPAFSPDFLLGAVLDAGGSQLTTVARQYIDTSGNANGEVDLGDLRAYLRRTGRL